MGSAPPSTAFVVLVGVSVAFLASHAFPILPIWDPSFATLVPR